MEILDSQSFKTKIFDYETNQEWKYIGEKPALIDFFADWCGPCRALAPILEELAQEYEGKLHVYKVDTEASPELAGLFGVRSIPSLLFVPKEGEPTMAAGLAPKERLKEVIQQVLGVAG
jgi:thioredoxin